MKTKREKEVGKTVTRMRGDDDCCVKRKRFFLRVLQKGFGCGAHDLKLKASNEILTLGISLLDYPTKPMSLKFRV